MKSKTIFKTEIVNGICPTCEQHSVLVSLVSDYFRCTICGIDLEQKINGKISYIPVMNSFDTNKIEIVLKNE